MSSQNELLELQKTFQARVEAQLDSIEAQMELLEAENGRLRRETISAGFERDACVGLLIRMAFSLGMKAGRMRTGEINRVLLDLPAGQVSWDYLDDEAHLFEWLPEYEGALVEQTVQDNYMKVMNPGI